MSKIITAFNETVNPTIYNHNYRTTPVGGYANIVHEYPAYRSTPANALMRTYSTTAEETPFYAPDLSDTLPKWDGEKADIDANWVITHVPDSHKSKSHKALLTDQTIGGVFFTPKVHNELTYVVEKLADVTGECAMFILTKQLSPQRPHWLAYDWFLPKQTASSGEVKISVADSEKYYNYLLEKYPHEFPNSRKLHEKLMHAHSHHRMALCNWSSVDHTQQSSRDELAYQGDYRLFFLFTIGHGVKATLVDYSRVTTRTDMFSGICFAEPEYVVALTNKRKRELDERMLKLVSKTSYATTSYVYKPGGVVTTPAITPNPVMPARVATLAEDPSDFAYSGAFDWEEAMYGRDVSMQGVTANQTKSVTVNKKHTSVYDILLDNQKSEFEMAASELIVALTGTAKSFGVQAEVDIRELKWADKIATAVRFKEVFGELFPQKLSTDTNMYINHFEVALTEYFVSSVVSEYIDDEDFNSVFDLPHAEIKDLIDRVNLMVETLAIYVGECATLFVLREESGCLSGTILENWYHSDMLTNAFTSEEVDVICQAITSPDEVDLSDVLLNLM